MKLVACTCNHWKICCQKCTFPYFLLTWCKLDMVTVLLMQQEISGHSFPFLLKVIYFSKTFLCSKKVLKGLCVQYPHFSRANPNVWPVLKSLTNCRQISDGFSLRKALGNKTIPYWGVVVTGEAEGQRKGGKQPRYLSAVEALIKTREDHWKKKRVQILQTALAPRAYGGGRGCQSPLNAMELSLLASCQPR